MRLIPRSTPEFLTNQNDAVVPQGGKVVGLMGTHPAVRELRANTASVVDQRGIKGLTSDSAADLSLIIG